MPRLITSMPSARLAAIFLETAAKIYGGMLSMRLAMRIMIYLLLRNMCRVSCVKYCVLRIACSVA